ncbi:MAG: prepilin-type N-terminal cleavage/methylation domain-containing protein [Alphaproteobacteria bacterium]|nr:prepilin-type N-terminal cleavage/methylation domain-containing protein [Alphaproteobacteria bacterium]
MTKTSARAQAGYTLIELLIVLALLGLISLAIAGGFRFGARAWERTESAIGAGETARGGHAALSALLGHIYPRARDALGTEPQSFEATAERIAFLADASAPFPARGVWRYTLSVERGKDGAALTLLQRSEHGPVAAREEVLLTGAKQIVFAFAEVKDGAVNWTDTWSGETTLPALIRVRVIFPPGGGTWPDLIVRPAIDRAANCIFDPVSFECRRG